MLALLDDLGTTALIAGVALAISTLCGSVEITRLLIGHAMGSTDLITMIVGALFSLLIEAPLPVFLLILYRTGVTPVVTEGLRQVALLLALIRVANLAVFGVNIWRSLHLPANSPFFATPVTNVISGIIGISSRAAMIIFLLALSRRVTTTREVKEGDAHLVRIAALVAVIVGALTMTGGLGFFVASRA